MPSRAPSPSIAILGLVCTALAFVLFAELIAVVGPVRATVITYINPAVAAVLGVAILAEPFTPPMAVGLRARDHGLGARDAPAGADDDGGGGGGRDRRGGRPRLISPPMPPAPAAEPRAAGSAA